MTIGDMIDTAIAADVNSNKPPVAAWVADAYIGASSQYVYRGVALRDNGPVVTAGLSFKHSSGWFIDTWAGRVDAENYYDYSRAREWLLDFSAGYGAQLSSAWQWSLSHAWVTGVDDSLPESQNYQEWRATLFYRDDTAIQFAYTRDYRQLGWPAWNIEIEKQSYLTTLFSGDMGLGHAHNSGFPDPDYNYVWLGLQTEWLATNWRLRWIYSGNNASYVLGNDRAGSRVELTLTWHFPVLR